MKKFVYVAALLLIGTPALADQFPGSMIAAFYMENYSVPKGWTLTYKGVEGGVQVFVMDRDLDAFPQTAFLQPVDQMRRVMCGDPSLKAMVAGGTVVRVDARDRNGGKTTLSKGPRLTSC